MSDERGLGLVVVGDAHLTLGATGPLEEAASFRRTLGGDAVLTAIVAARAGVEVALVTRVGEDPFSDWMLQSFEAEGLHLDYTRQVAGPSPLLLVGAGHEGRQSARYVGGAAAATMEPADLADIPWDLVRLLFVAGSFQSLGPEQRRTAVAAFETARGAGVRTVHDPALVPGLWSRDDQAQARAAFESLLPHTDLLILTAPYASGRLLGRPLAAEAAEEARLRGVAAVVVRHADGSAVVAEQRELHRLEAPADRAGLGDPSRPAIFDGVLLAALGSGLPLLAATELALAADRATPPGPRELGSLPDAARLAGNLGIASTPSRR
ncbi:MAG: hypothetical protein H6744_21020 [Deltaproteobacteria bacterium]|nr:hypothetical protein [Deltaproteobacteria bacterium]